MTSNKVIDRLLQYRLCLIKFKNLGFETIFSYTLGEEAGVTAEQVRKDFSQYAIKGNKKGGYIINDLLITINDIFRRHEKQNIIIVGMGNIGKALSQYKGFKTSNINIVAGLEVDPSKINKKTNIPIFHINALEEIIKKYHVRVAVLAIPEQAAQQVCDKLVETGIIGILNFSPHVLKTPANIVINNVNLGNELEGLIYITNFVQNKL